MSITINSLPRMTEAEAEATTKKQNEIFGSEGIIAKTGQLNK